MMKKCTPNKGAPNCLRPNRDFNDPSGTAVAFRLSSGSVNGDFQQVADPSPGVHRWALIGGNPAQDYVIYTDDPGEASVYLGGVEMYAGIASVDGTLFGVSVWFATGGIEPTPILS